MCKPTTMTRGPAPIQLPFNPHKRPSLEEDGAFFTPDQIWKRQCTTDVHVLSPPPTPRGQRSTSRHFFVFDDAELAGLLLPDLAQALQDEDELPLSLQLAPSFDRPSPRIVPPKPRFQFKRHSTLAQTAKAGTQDDEALMPPPPPSSKTNHQSKTPTAWDPLAEEGLNDSQPEYARCA